MEKIIKIQKYCLLTIFYIVISICMFSCQKAPINNKIQGLWILKEFTILENGEKNICERLYYSIGRFVTEISEKQGNNGYGTYIGITEFANDETKIILKDFKIRKGSGDEGIDAPVEKLLPFGINNQKETIFEIVNCNGKSMTLESDYARLELEKF